MLLALLGPPCRFTRMCITMAQAALDQLYGGCDVVCASDVAALKNELARVTRPHVLLHSEAPDEGLVETLRRSDARYVIATADPVSVVRDLMAERNIDVCAAIRAASRYFSTVHDLALGPKAIVIRRMDYEYNVESIVSEVMRSVGKSPGPDEIDAVLSSLFPDGRVDSVWCVSRILDNYFSGQSPQQLTSVLDRDGIWLVDSVLGDFSKIGSDQFREAFWAPATFLSVDNAGGALPSVVYLTGPFRCPVYGPYVHLPDGVWRVTCTLRVIDNHGQVNFRVDVFSDRVLFETDLRLPVNGEVQCRFEFSSLGERAPIQVRFIQTQGAIEGRMEFGGVMVERSGRIPR